MTIDQRIAELIPQSYSWLEDLRRGLRQEVSAYEQVIRSKKQLIAGIERELSKQRERGMISEG